MLNIGQTSFNIRVPSLPRDEFELYSTNLFDVWEREIAGAISFDDYAISLEIEEGSITGRGKIAIVAGALYFGIGNYGGFIGGLETIYDQVIYVGERLFQEAKAPVGGNSAYASKRTNAGAISSMRRLFERVQNRSMTVDEAMSEVETLLGEELDENSEFVQEMRRQLESAPAYPEQLSFTDDDWAELDAPESPVKVPGRPKRNPSPPPEHFRIEIWRESRNDQKHVRFTRVK